MFLKELFGKVSLVQIRSDLYHLTVCHFDLNKKKCERFVFFTKLIKIADDQKKNMQN